MCMWCGGGGGGGGGARVCVCVRVCAHLRVRDTCACSRCVRACGVRVRVCVRACVGARVRPCVCIIFICFHRTNDSDRHTMWTGQGCVRGGLGQR